MKLKLHRSLQLRSIAMVENSDVLIGIGGGEVARDELIGAIRSGKEVRFIPAQPMNHQKVREKAQKKGLPVPTNLEKSIMILLSTAQFPEV